MCATYILVLKSLCHLVLQIHKDLIVQLIQERGNFMNAVTVRIKTNLELGLNYHCNYSYKIMQKLESNYYLLNDNLRIFKLLKWRAESCGKGSAREIKIC